jgi:DNA polymerase III sliding clamp (beta) subunit (PCNA family)
VFGYYCFTGTDVFSFNDSFGIVAPCPIPKPFACHGNTLLGLLKNSTSEEVQFELKKECLQITAGESLFQLPYKGPDEFLWKEPDEDGVCEFMNVTKTLETCLTTCSSDASLAAFNQIAFINKIARLSVYSSDGDAITRIILSNNASSKDYSIALPRNFCDALVKCALELESNYEVFSSAEWVYALFDNDYRIYGRSLGEPVLNYEEEIRDSIGDDKSEFIPVPEGLNDALSRARIVADVETKPTQLSLMDDSIRLFTETNVGIVDDVIPIKGHIFIEVNVSAALIQRSLEECTEFKVTENCLICRGENILRIVANMG